MAEAKNYVELPLEEIMGDRFGRYSKYIIQDRALPDVRDGLKPVQRRILYAMHMDKNTHDKNFRKAAKTVGTVIGNYHPHGDSSVYDAMVRLSQSWKMRHDLVEMHGNNGSIDGDPAAAMRYTEARLSKITAELLADIEKDTVDFIPNFDDTIEEPIVFPGKLPNLLVNGSTGISAGYATNIPPHNLEEVINAVIKKIDYPDASVDMLMKEIKGPDFPTGGIVQGAEGIKNAYETGKGKVMVRGKATIESMKGNREQIVIDEIPYDVNKANLVRKMDELHADRKVEGISEIRDETDRKGLRIVIELRKDVDGESVLQYFYKNTDLQITYHYNMVAIENKTPQLLSLPQILDAYIAHQKEVVTKRTKHDLNKAKERSHIVEGLIKAISILDELITMIRNSSNKKDAKQKIMAAYSFTDTQAEAILALQLYRLTNTDVTQLQDEASTLAQNIKEYESILASPEKLLNNIKKELRSIRKTYQSNRLTSIEAEIEEIKIDLAVTVPSEDVLVSITKEGYVKRTSLRSYGASKQTDLLMKSTDRLIRLLELHTTDDVLIFTNKGKFACIPVYDLPDIKWKDMGNHLSNLTTLDADESVVDCIPVREFTDDAYLVFYTKQGMLKKTVLSEYKATRYSRSLIALNLKDADEVLGVLLTEGDQDLFLASYKGYGLWMNESDISPIGLRARGVIGMSLKEDDFLVHAATIDENKNPDLLLVTQRGACKRMKLSAFQKSARARRGLTMLRELKSKPHRLKGLLVLYDQEKVFLYTDREDAIEVVPQGLPVSDRNSNGSFIIEPDLDGTVQEAVQETIYETPFPTKLE
ncbi:MAG TPA: DNA topoisomerase IV subunit A [Pseudogracilibacillus sp.]|nr:DNA topoisomerase IV subunit A [Pseudogracilibacillus sp.]